MLNRDSRDLVGGGAIALLGLAIALYSYANYQLGSVTHMGPGMVPTLLGGLLLVFGLIIVVTAAPPVGSAEEARVLAPLIILASLAVFALLVTRTGMMPAIFVSTLIACAAELKFRPVVAVALALALCVMAYLIFTLGLSLTYPLFAWSF